MATFTFSSTVRPWKRRMFQDVSLGRSVDTGDQVEHRRLACAVGPDQAVQRTRADREVQLGHGLQAAEADARLAQFQIHRAKAIAARAGAEDLTFLFARANRAPSHGPPLLRRPTHPGAAS
jgi:hypothetical protein